MASAQAPNRLLNAQEALLLVVDIQEKFVPAIEDAKRVIERTRIMLQSCTRLGVPVVVSEQYPKGLGHTVSDLSKALPPDAVTLEKSAFGCGADPGIQTHLAQTGRKQIMICGIESHVCVNQTTHQLLEAGYQVHLIQDALASRHKKNHKIALSKMHQSGAIPSCVEMALFEMLGTARHACFKELQALIK